MCIYANLYMKTGHNDNGRGKERMFNECIQEQTNYKAKIKGYALEYYTAGNLQFPKRDTSLLYLT